MLSNKENAFEKYNEDYKKYILQEAYVGKTETLLEIEKKVHEVRSDCKNRKFKHMNSMKSLQELNRLIEKQFGMDIFALYIEPSSTINAGTAVIGTHLTGGLLGQKDLSKMVTGNKTDGYRFKEGNKLAVMVVVYTGLLCDDRFTDAEIVAVLLHEIGHNFADAMYDKIRIYNQDLAMATYFYLLIISILTAGVGFLDIYFKTNAHERAQAKHNKFMHPFEAIYNASLNIISDFINFSIGFLGRVTGISAKRINKFKRRIEGREEEIKKNVKDSVPRQNEVFADKFAAIYGYGPETASLQYKFDYNESKAKKAVDKVLGKEKNEKTDIAYIDLNDFDCHPNSFQRSYEVLSTLENELKSKDLDPKLKKVLEEQVKQIKDLNKQAIDVSSKTTELEEERAKYYMIVSKKCPLAVEKDVEDAIEKAFNDGLKKLK